MTKNAMQVTYSFGQSRLLEGLSTSADLLVRFRMPSALVKRRPVNLALVIDVSGSMAGSPLKHAIRASQSLVDELDDGDTLSVVVYDDHVRTLIEPTGVKDREALKQKIGGIQAGGLTNLSGGWLKGIEHVKARASADVVSRVLLLTDGEANVGMTKNDVLIKTAAKHAEEGVPTTTLGFGRGFNEDLLLGMARAAGGNFYFIQSTDDARDVFNFELQTMKAVAAQNLSVTLKPAPGVQLEGVLSLHRGGNTGLTLELGDVYEDEDKLLGLRLALPEFKGGLHDLLELSYAADAVQDGVIAKDSGTLSVQSQFGPLDASVQTDTEVTLDLARLRIAKAKEDAVALADQGQNAAGEKLLRDLIGDLTRSGLHEHFEIAEEIEQLEHYASRIARNLDADSRKELVDQSFQGFARTSSAMSGRGVTVDTAVLGLNVVQDAGSGVELACLREGGKLRIKVIADGYDHHKNVQFPRALRADGAHYIVDALETSADGSFYRVNGEIKRIVRAGEADPLQHLSIGGRSSARRQVGSGATVKAAKTAADLEETGDVGSGILVQCVKDGSKLRARVVQDGYEPDWNMRFPRSVREEGMLYVVDEVDTAPDGKSYIAKGDIKRFVQAT